MKRFFVLHNFDTSERLLKFINGHTLVKGSVVNLTNPEVTTEGFTIPESQYLYTLVDDQLAKLNGPGYGPQGLIKIAGQFHSQVDVQGQTSEHPNQVRYINFRIKKVTYPGFQKLI